MRITQDDTDKKIINLLNPCHPRLKDKFITGQEYRPKPPYSEESPPDGFIKSAVTSALKRTPS